MTVRECAIIEAYTGICMLTGNKRQYLYQYAEEAMGMPIYTHYFVSKTFLKNLKAAAEKDFISICKNSEEPMEYEE